MATPIGSTQRVVDLRVSIINKNQIPDKEEISFIIEAKDV
jgi:hypothetical protein